MNIIKLKGILKNIEFSHYIQDIEFNKAQLVVSRSDGKEDCINLRFKKYSNPYKEDSVVSLAGNIRSYSTKLDDGRNKVDLYVFTYFDLPELNEEDTEDINVVVVDGRICKMENLRTTKTGKHNVHFILANNLIVSDGAKKLNSYIPCICWGKDAEIISKLPIDTRIQIVGELHSREYKKVMPDGSFEFRVAHECVVKSYKIV